MLLSVTIFSPRLTDTLTAETDMLNLLDNSVMFIPNSWTAQKDNKLPACILLLSLPGITTGSRVDSYGEFTYKMWSLIQKGPETFSNHVQRKKQPWTVNPEPWSPTAPPKAGKPENGYKLVLCL